MVHWLESRWAFEAARTARSHLSELPGFGSVYSSSLQLHVFARFISTFFYRLTSWTTLSQLEHLCHRTIWQFVRQHPKKSKLFAIDT